VDAARPAALELGAAVSAQASAAAPGARAAPANAGVIAAAPSAAASALVPVIARVVVRARRPAVGLGCGGLLVAMAGGGRLHEDTGQRAYWTTARATAAGAGDPVAQALDGRQVLVVANGRVDPPGEAEPLVVDEAGEWIVLRDGLAYALLCRPEMKPGMIEDMIMEEDRPLPADIDAVLAQSRTQWQDTQRTTDLVAAALVSALDLMRERRKPPVFTVLPNPAESVGALVSRQLANLNAPAASLGL